MILSDNLIYSENFHLNALVDPNIYYKLDAFNLRPFKGTNYNIYQNLSPHYKTSEDLDQIRFGSHYYNLKPALTTADLALGDNDMNHAWVRFEKGDILNLNNLHFNFSYLGHEGNWMGEPESGYSYRAQFFYTYKENIIDVNLISIDQDYSSRRFGNYTTSLSTTNEEIFSPSVMWYNRICNIGYRHEQWKVDDEERVENQIIANKGLSYNKLTADITLEYFQSDALDNKDNFSSSLNLDYQHKYFLIQCVGYLQDSDHYYGEIEGSYLFADIIEPFSSYSTTRDIDEDNELKFGLRYKNPSGWIELSYVKPDTAYTDYWLESSINMHHQINRFEIRLRSWLKYYPDDEYQKIDNYQLLPQIQTKNSLEITCLLNYGNHISCGVEQLYHSEIEQQNGNSILQYNSSMIDLFVAIGITSQFEIRADVKNLTGAEYLFNNQDILLPNTHFNARLIWYFIN